MENLSEHGGALGELEYLTAKIAYCKDGKILVNKGDGWKRWRKLKPGADMATVWPQKKADYEQRLRENPCYADYRAALRDLVSFENRAIVHEMISTLGNDADGCWSELSDYDAANGTDIALSVEEIQRLADTYEWWQREVKEKQDKAAPVAAGAEAPA